MSTTTTTPTTTTTTTTTRYPKGDGDGDDDDDGITLSEHPSPILHAPRDNIPRKGNPSLRYRNYIGTCIGNNIGNGYIYIYIYRNYIRTYIGNDMRHILCIYLCN